MHGQAETTVEERLSTISNHLCTFVFYQSIWKSCSPLGVSYNFSIYLLFQLGFYYKENMINSSLIKGDWLSNEMFKMSSDPNLNKYFSKMNLGHFKGLILNQK